MPSWRRLKTAKSRLEPKWREHRPAEERVLDVQEIIEALRQDDPRPLLIWRDCEGCKNKEGDLLKRTLEDERIILAMPWFHCVKLGHDTIEEDHPYNKLFQGSIPAHVIVTSWDGKRVESVPRAGQKEVWKSMQKILQVSYKKSATSAMKGLSKILEQYDALDEREQELMEQLAVKEERGKTSRADKIREEIIEVGLDRDKAIEREKELYDLELKHVEERDAEETDS
jgi:hypothetical protein